MRELLCWVFLFVYLLFFGFCVQFLFVKHPFFIFWGRPQNLGGPKTRVFAPSLFSLTPKTVSFSPQNRAIFVKQKLYFQTKPPLLYLCFVLLYLLCLEGHRPIPPEASSRPQLTDVVCELTEQTKRPLSLGRPFFLPPASQTPHTRPQNKLIDKQTNKKKIS